MVVSKKYVLLYIFLVLMSALASSGHGGGQTVPDSYNGQTVDYTGNLHVLNPEGEDVKVTACGGTKLIQAGTQGGTADVKIPKELPCGLGTHQVEWNKQNPGGRQETFEFTVKSTKSKPNKGYYIVSRFGLASDTITKSNTHMEDFFITNTPWNDQDGIDFNEFPTRDSGRAIPKGAFFLISEADRDLNDKSDEGVFVAEYGNIITSFGSSLIEHSYGGYGPAGNSGFAASDPEGVGRDNVYDVFELPFDSGYKFPNGNMDNECSVSSGDALLEWNDCAPLHKNGKYDPQGQIIIASQPDAPFADSTDRPLSISPKTHFYVCRNDPGDPDWQGDKPSNSKVVKVQQEESGNLVDEWKYYHCNNLNAWEEIECPPGQEMDRKSGELKCVNKDPVTVNVKFFDISGVPQKSSGDSVIAGFKVNSSEVAKYENFMDQDLKRIDAECWMGDDDGDNGNLPSSSETGTFRLNYDGSGDAWVLGEIPYRTGVNNNTYSCVWGFSDRKTSRSPDDYSIYASTRHPPFRSVEGSRVPIDYSTLRSEYSDFRSNELEKGISRDNLWTPYSGGDSRPYTDSTQTDMFDFPNAFPYCTTPTSPSSVLANIICS